MALANPKFATYNIFQSVIDHLLLPRWCLTMWATSHMLVQQATKLRSFLRGLAGGRSARPFLHLAGRRTWRRPRTPRPRLLGSRGGRRHTSGASSWTMHSDVFLEVAWLTSGSQLRMRRAGCQACLCGSTPHSAFRLTRAQMGGQP